MLTDTRRFIARTFNGWRVISRVPRSFLKQNSFSERQADPEDISRQLGLIRQAFDAVLISLDVRASRDSRPSIWHWSANNREEVPMFTAPHSQCHGLVAQTFNLLSTNPPPKVGFRDQRFELPARRTQQTLLLLTSKCFRRRRVAVSKRTHVTLRSP